MQSDFKPLGVAVTVGSLAFLIISLWHQGLVAASQVHSPSPLPVVWLLLCSCGHAIMS